MIDALYFDGRSGRGWPVRLQRDGSELRVDFVAEAEMAPPASQRWPLADVEWPERTRHGRRVLHLRGGGTLQVADAAAFDAWRQGAGPADGWVVRLQQHWPATLAAVAALVGVVAAGYLWGLPWAAPRLLRAIPPDVDRAVGTAAWSGIEPRWVEASAVRPARQAQLRAAFDRAVQAAFPAGDAPAYELRFAVAAKAIGPNAFALPGGTIVVTDALVEMLDGRDDVLVGVLAHEFGHVRNRHGMQSLLQFALLNAATSVLFGDFSSVLAGVPAVIGQLGYSRDAERQADAECARVLRAAGLSPAVMLVLFERLEQQQRFQAQPLGLASHPANAERVRYFELAAAVR